MPGEGVVEDGVTAAEAGGTVEDTVVAGGMEEDTVVAGGMEEDTVVAGGMAEDMVAAGGDVVAAGVDMAAHMMLGDMDKVETEDMAVDVVDTVAECRCC
ncbi:hypothetical protein RJT34_04069 [Clitoria ternatea]|uniref:Uncharacterized protein n=1 Tax=Clitoria ternatea TaxID=43366 RepID=A0AAN9KLB5_CLITE